MPEGIDQRSPCRHPDWTGPDDLEIKIHELREITDWEKPIYVKVGAARPYYDTALAVKSGADVVVLDGMQGGTAATQDVFIEHVGIPTLAAIRPAVQALIDLDMHRKVQLIVSGGIRNGADVAKALALGADAVSIGTAALIALGDNDPRYEDEYRKLGTTAGCYDDWHEGRDPAGITTQDPELVQRLDPVAAGRRLANYLSVLTLEAQTIARACGKSHLHNLEPEDLVALTMESAAMAQVPLAGTNWIPGKNGEHSTSNANVPGQKGSTMATFGAYAKKNGIKYFLISFVDLFGTMRAKLVPATAIDTMAKAGAGFAGFAVWFDMTPAHADILVMADLDTAIQLPWKPEVAWVTGDLMMDGKPVTQNPRQVLKRVIADAAKDGYDMKTGVECEYFPDFARRQRDLGRRRHAGEALLRPAGADAPLRDHHRDLRLHDRARLGAVPERPRGRERPVRDELGVRLRRSRPPTSTRSSSSWSSRSPRSTACARPSCRSRSRTSPATAATRMCRCGRRTRTCSTIRRASSGCPASPTTSSAA